MRSIALALVVLLAFTSSGQTPAPSRDALKLSIDGVPVAVRGAVSRTQGGRGIEVVLSSLPLTCGTFARTWAPRASDEFRVTLTLSALLLERGPDRKYAPPNPAALRVGYVDWTGPPPHGTGMDVTAGGSATVSDLGAIRAKRPTTIPLSRRARFGPVGSSPERTLTVDGAIRVISCGDYPPEGDNNPQADIEFTVGGQKVAFASATFSDFDGYGAKTLVLATGPQGCSSSALVRRPWDVYLIARWQPGAPDAAPQVTLQGAAIPSALGVLGTEVRLREAPVTDAARADVAIDVRWPDTMPIVLRGTAHARRCSSFPKVP